MTIEEEIQFLRDLQETCDCYEIIIPGRIPSKKDGQSVSVRKSNSPSGYSPFIRSSNKHLKWKELTSIYLLKNYPNLIGLKLPYVKYVDVTFEFGDRRNADLQNKWETIADILHDKNVRITEDDNHFVMGDQRHHGILSSNKEFKCTVKLYVPSLQETEEYLRSVGKLPKVRRKKTT